MDKRFTIFMVLAVAAIAVNQIIFAVFFPQPVAPPEEQKPAQVAKAEPGKDGPAKVESDKIKVDGAKPGAAPAEGQAQAAPAEPTPPAQDQAAAGDDKKSATATRWVTLGSADPQSSYRMLVTLTNRGAAIERLELNSARYHELDDRSGYLGHLSPDDAPSKGGAIVHLVGPGTPAAQAGLQVNDVIKVLGDQKITSAADLIEALSATKPRQELRIVVDRQGAEQQLTAELGRRPLEVMRPEQDSLPVEIVKPNNHDPLSFLLTIQQFDDRTLGDDNQELGGLSLRTDPWEVAAAEQNVVSFQKTLPKLGLKLTKTYHLEKVSEDQAANTNYPAYSLMLDISITNISDQKHSVAYRLDGPTGLPIEGAWYANKVGRTWSAAGLRDVIARFEGGATTQVTCPQIAAPDFKLSWTKTPLDYIAVDAQYFAAALIPQKEKPTDVWFAEAKPTRVGEVPEDKANIKLTNVSFRLDSVTTDLDPDGASLKHRFQIFAGPKKPALLAEYGPPGTTITLHDLLYYGWFGFVAVPMLAILHVFHTLVGNYGLAIIMLTVLVRGCMFPLSRKQTLSAQKMQELQPEIKRLTEKYKSEPEKKTKAQQELFRQHNYNPLGGCLLAFVQLPIFVGLYRSLMVDVELRQAPLFGEAIRWASNLAAPDMFWNWTSVVPDFVAHGTGFFALGPYLNILPLITIGLMIWQQRMTMPPPADEQAALQQKMMQYMMIFMAIVFFKVASGLCVYFIASSIWGLTERKLLPKTIKKPAPAGSGPAVSLSGASNSGNGAASGKKRQRGRK